MNQTDFRFSHIYIEKQALSFEQSAAVLKRFKTAHVVEIEHYKDIFNRPRQDWRAQKLGQNLVLAVRRDNFLYPGSSATCNFNYKNFYYNSLVLNCLFDCDYCYLQGLYPSAHMIMFVNTADYFSAALETLKAHSPLFLCISYDTDLLALEHIWPYCRSWIEFARQHPELVIEIRTKSVNFQALADLKPAPNIVLAWTLSPRPIVERYEHGTPALESRLKTIRQALHAGWRVRLCFDPLLFIADWEKTYAEFIQEVFSAVHPEEISDITLGVFRMNGPALKKIQKQRSGPDILFYPFSAGNELTSYADHHRQALLDFVHQELQATGPLGGKIFTQPGPGVFAH